MSDVELFVHALGWALVLMVGYAKIKEVRGGHNR